MVGALSPVNRDRQRDRQRQRQTDRQRQRDRDRQRQRDREIERQRQTDVDRHRHRQTDKQTDRQRLEAEVARSEKRKICLYCLEGKNDFLELRSEGIQY